MLILKDIAKSYNYNLILDGVSFSLDHEVAGLIGPNGVGKSTVFKIVAGIENTDAGSVGMQGVVGYLPQHFEFNDVTVGDFLKAEYDYQIDIVLEQVGLARIDRTQKAQNLSGGQKTRLYLAGILLKEPNILLLDEPTNNLDLKGLQWLEGFIKDFPGTVLLTSHDRYFLEETGITRYYAIENGNLKEAS
jgi:ATPase subunit of ABC transporter with duplicated ATPase domains